MNLHIRVDADSKIGTGHIMRCIALAQTYQEQGGQVTFISHCESTALRDRIQIEGFRFISLKHVCPDTSDLVQTLSILKNESSDSKPWLVLDGYHFTPDYHKVIRDAGINLLVIDDMNHLPRYHADILLNQNIHAPNLKYHCDEDTILLLGTPYTLLRKEFLKYRDFRRHIPVQAKNILVTIGGADPENVSLKVVEALNLLKGSDITVKIIIGPANPHQKTLDRTLSSVHFDADLLLNPLNIPELMAWADIAVSAGGSTCWELVFMKVPSIILVLAENQEAIAEYLMNKSAVLNLGFFTKCSKEQISDACEGLIGNRVARTSLSQQNTILIDGQGTNRVIKSMNINNLSIRDVTALDCELIWHWANDEDTRKASYTQAYIPWDKHIQWFESVRKQKKDRFYIADVGNKRPLGQIRFTIDGKNAVVSFSVAPESRKKGYGKEILIKATKKLFNEENIEQISAYIKSENEASLRVFQRAGFRLAEKIDVCGVPSRRMTLNRMDLL